MSERVTNGAEWFTEESESLSELNASLTKASADDWIVHTICSCTLRDGSLLYTVIAWRPNEPKKSNAAK